MRWTVEKSIARLATGSADNYTVIDKKLKDYKTDMQRLISVLGNWKHLKQESLIFRDLEDMKIVFKIIVERRSHLVERQIPLSSPYRPVLNCYREPRSASSGYLQQTQASRCFQ
jgi:hypothetical protein